VGPQQAVDEESTCQTRMPTEDGHEMPFFLTGGVKSIIPSCGRVWRWVSEAAAAAEVAVMVIMLSSIFYVVSVGERRCFCCWLFQLNCRTNDGRQPDEAVGTAILSVAILPSKIKKTRMNQLRLFFTN
jgi:hypothetical protein